MTEPRFDTLRRRPDLPFIAGGSDIVVGAPCKVAKGVWEVVNCSVVADEPIGVAHASAPKGTPVAVRDRGEIVRAQACASITGGDHVGIATINVVAGASGNVQEILYGPVTKSSGVSVWSVGQALENAGPGITFSFYVNPTNLSGAE